MESSLPGLDDLATRLRDSAAPAWAKGFHNARGHQDWDYAQYVVVVAIGDVLIDALVETGGACTILDFEYAKSLGLPVQEQTCSKFGATSLIPPHRRNRGAAC